VIEFSIANFLHLLVLGFLPNKHHRLWIKRRNSSVLTLRLKKSATYHFSKPSMMHVTTSMV